MYKSFRYKAKISKTTEKTCFRWLDLCRTLYNAALEQKMTNYKQFGKSMTTFDQIKQLPEMKREFTEFKEIDSGCLQWVIERLHFAYNKFFQRLRERKQKSGFPKFKGKDEFTSFILKHQGWKLEGRNLYITKVGRFKLFLSRPIEGRIKTVNVKREPTEDWFVTFVCDVELQPPLVKKNQDVGIDIGLINICADSTGRIIKNPEFFEQNKKILRRQERNFSRKKRGSKRYYTSRKLIAKTYAKISNQRKDFLHKLSKEFVDNFDNIFVEKLDMEPLVKTPTMRGKINKAGWANFLFYLKYKAVWNGRNFAEVPPYYTTQNCSHCGYNVKKHHGERIHDCPKCKIMLDRDVNAAINILRLGQSRQVIIAPVRDDLST